MFTMYRELCGMGDEGIFFSLPLCGLLFEYENNIIPLTGGVRDDTISLELIVSSGLLSRYRIYVKPFLLRTGAVFYILIKNLF